MTRSTRVLFFFAPLICAAIPLVCMPAAHWITVSPKGNHVLSFAMILVLFGLVAMSVFVASLPGLIFPRVRRISACLALCSVAYVAAYLIACEVGERIRMRAFHRLAERSRPLIAAIRAFEQKHGHPPESLEKLVPEFIPSVPSTGMGACPEYHYSTVSTNYEGNPWVLIVNTPSGGINWDQFMYFPLTNYPKSGYGGPLERVGDWAYVHE